MNDKQSKMDLAKLNPTEQLDFLKSLLESSTEYSIIAKDLNRNILTWNKGAKRLYGYTSEEIIGKNADILNHPEDVKSGKVDAMFAEVQKIGVWTGEVRRVRKDGSHFTALVTITLRKNSKNKRVGYTLISRDLTEIQDAMRLLGKLKSSEELLQIRNKELGEAIHQALESNRQKSDFLANVSHELRTPLNGILGFTELLYDRLVEPGSAKYDEFLGDIISSAKQLLALINDVLDISKIEAGKMEFYPEKIDTAKILAETHNIFHTLITEKDIHFKIQIDRSLGKIIIDPRRLKQVLYNYISNALKFTPPGGKVSVRLRPADSKKNFYIEVSDTGIGIHEEDIKKLFTKFHQLDFSASKQYQGTGLGLGLTKEIVEAQGGQVGVESLPGKGSTFYALLPAFPYHQPITINKKKESEAVLRKRFPKVLVIENKTEKQSLLKDALKFAGYKVITTNTISKSVKQKKTYTLDAIILDLFTADKTDVEKIRSIRHKRKPHNAPPIVITATVDKPINLSFKITDILTKPVSSRTLLVSLEWIGIRPHEGKTVLIIDNDKKAVNQAKKILAEKGIHVICKANSISALLALEQDRPDIVLIDPLMAGMEGLEFLRFIRKNENNQSVPIIVWIANLNQDESMELKASIGKVVDNEENLKNYMIAELTPLLPPSKA